MSPASAPVAATLQQIAQPVATVGNDLNEELAVAPHRGQITAVSYFPTTTITGANTNTRKVVLVNKTKSLTVATLQFDSGVNATAATAKAIPITAGNDLVELGDVLEWQSTHVGTGIADPGGLVTVTIQRGEIST